MELSYGISGFYHSSEPKPPDMDVRKYKELCFSLARKIGGELLEFVDTPSPANFYKAEFSLPKTNICLVMNRHYPIVAFSSAVEGMDIQFIDYSEGLQGVPEEYKVLSVDQLNNPVPENGTELQGMGLNRSEIAQIKYWKPETVGGIIFNFWD